MTGVAARVEQEAHLLAAVAGISPLPVPEPRFTVAEQGCLAYFKMPGVPLLDVPQPERSAQGPSIAARVGELLTTLLWHRDGTGQVRRQEPSLAAMRWLFPVSLATS
jgi:hypothetical protein